MSKYSCHLLVLLFCCVLKIRSGECDEEGHAIKLEDVIVDFFNATYLDEDTFDISINYNTDSENTMKLRVDVIEELPMDIHVKIKVLGRAFGQYKVPTGIALDIDMCDGQINKYYLESMFKKMGVTQCPPQKGVYQVGEFPPDLHGLPLYALPGFYLLVEVKVYSKDISLIELRAYMHIY